MKKYQNFICILKKKKLSGCGLVNLIVVPKGAKRGSWIPTAGVTGIVSRSIGCRNQNLGPLQEHSLYTLNCSAISPDSVFLIIHPNFNCPEFIWCHVAKSYQFLSICTQLSLLVLLEQYHINSYGNETHCASKCAQW